MRHLGDHCQQRGATYDAPLYEDATWSLTRFPGQWLCGIDCVVATGGIASRGVDVVSDLYYFAAHVADLRH